MNFIDGLQSLVIGTATFLLLLTDINGKFGFLYYTGDFFLTAILVVVTIKHPISEIANAFKEITGGITLDNEITTFINDAVSQELIGIEYSTNIYKKGMFITIVVNIKTEINDANYKLLVKKKQAILDIVKEKYQNTSLDYQIG